MSIREKSKSRLSQFSTPCREDVHTGLGQRPVPDSDVVFSTTVCAAHVQLGFLCLNDRIILLKKKTQHCLGYVGTSTRAVACALANQPQPLLCVHIHPRCRTATKNSSLTVEIRLCSSSARPTPTTPPHPQDSHPASSHSGKFLRLRCVWPPFLLEVGEISGHVILQLLQNTNDLTAACLNFHHLDNSGHRGRSWLS